MTVTARLYADYDWDGADSLWGFSEYTGDHAHAKAFAAGLALNATFKLNRVTKAGALPLSGQLTVLGHGPGQVRATLTSSGALGRFVSSGMGAAAPGLSFNHVLTSPPGIWPPQYVNPLSIRITYGGRTFNSSETPTGFLTLFHRNVTGPTMTATLTFTGAITRQPHPVKAGTSTFSGAIARVAGKALAGGLTPSAGLTIYHRTITPATMDAGLSFTGLRTWIWSVNPNGSLTPAGTLTRRDSRAQMAAGLTESATLSRKDSHAATNSSAAFAGSQSRKLIKAAVNATAPLGGDLVVHKN